MTEEKLAIEGGAPVRAEPMPPRFSYGPAERRMIDEVLDFYQARGEDPGYQGPFEDRYCRQFAERLGGGYADAVATGTASVYIALAALELPKGSDVLLSPITDPGSVSAIIMNGLKPRMIDSRPGTFNTGKDEVVARISENTSALVLVHNAGKPVPDTAEIVAACHARGVKVVEDCSQAHGASIDGTQVGAFGDIAAFSTMYRKNSITGSSGGVVYTRDKALFDNAMAHADRGKPRHREGFDDRNPNQFLFPAMNFHTDEISCAVGIASFGRLDETIEKRLAYARGVQEGLRDGSNVCRMETWGTGDSPFILPVHVAVDAISCPKQAFAEATRAEGIGLNPHYQYLVAEWPWVQPYLSDDFPCPVAREVRDSSFALYVNENYGPAEVEDTVRAIAKVERRFAAG